MNENAPPSPRPDELNVLDYIAVLRKRWRVVVGVAGGLATITLLYCLLTPKIFESRATLVTPSETAGGGLRSALMASAMLDAMPGMRLSSLSPNRDLFLAVLRSQRMSRDVIERFHLRERFGAELVSEARDVLDGMVKIDATDEGTITVRVESKEPQLAADIANYFVSNLDAIVNRLETSDASRQRAFVSTRLAETELDLRKAEEALQLFQERHKAFALQEQAKGLVEEVARLKGQIIAEEVYLEGLLVNSSDTNPEVVKLRRRIDAMKEHLESQFGPALGIGPLSPDPVDAPVESPQIDILPFKDFPELGLQLARLTRDVQIHTTVFTLLTQQLEEAKIAEARDTPKVQVVDEAVPADRKSRPKIRASVMVAACLGLFAGVLLCFGLEYWEELRAKYLARLARRHTAQETADDAAEAGASESENASGTEQIVAGQRDSVNTEREPAEDEDEPAAVDRKRRYRSRKSRRASKKEQIASN